MDNFKLLPLSRFVGLYGLSHFNDAMTTLREITRRFTAEFDLRPFLVAHPERTLAKLTAWREDADLHVRRLVSEGTRTRLPWSYHLRQFQRDPQKVVNLIEPLREDSSRYVRLSVANNLADILKDDKDFGLGVAREWLGKSSERGEWVVRHALRYFSKNKHASPEQLIRQIERKAPIQRNGSLFNHEV